MKPDPHHKLTGLPAATRGDGRGRSEAFAAVQTRAAARRHFFRFHTGIRLESESDAERQALSQGVPLDVSYGGEPLAGYVSGDGPTVLCVHGRLGRGGQFYSFVPYLADAGFRAVVFDAPGHGRSPGDFVHTDCVALAIALIERRYGPFHALVCHSVGALWSLAALSSGVQASRIICLNPLAQPEAALREYSKRSRLSPPVAKAFEDMLRSFDAAGEPKPDSLAVGPTRLRGLVLQSEHDPFVSCAASRAFADAWALDFAFVECDDHEEVLYDGRVLSRCVEFLRSNH